MACRPASDDVLGLKAKILKHKLVALPLLALALAPHGAFAAEGDADGQDIIVRGQGLPDSPGTPAYDSVVIDRDRLSNDASRRIEDILADVAGFQQFRRTDSRAANPTSQGATLRALGGNASSRALVLLDGVPVADPFTGYIPFSAIDPARLGSARVTRGGGAGAFGSGAVAGTIELASAGIDKLSPIWAQGFYGSRGATDLSGGAALPLGGGFVTLGGGWQQGDGYILVPKSQRGIVDVPAQYDMWNVALRAVAPVSATSEIQASISGFDDSRLRGLPGARNLSNGVDASVRFVSHGDWALDALAYVQTRNFSSRTITANAARTTTSVSLDQYSTPSTGVGGKIELRPPVGDSHVLRLGVDARRASGATHERATYVSGRPTRLRAAGGNSLVSGAFIEDDWTIGDLVLTGGGRIDRWLIRDGYLREQVIATGAFAQNLSFTDRSGWRGSGRVGALYHATQQLDLRAAGYTGFRVPTLNELYRPFRVGADATAANANLRLEKLGGFEGGIEWRPADGVRIAATAFHNKLRDAIANVTVAQGPGTFPQVGFVNGAYRQRQNLDAITVNGVELSGDVRSGPWTLTASYAFSDPKVSATGAAAPLNGKRPAQSPRHAAAATLSVTPMADTSLSATVRYIGAQYEDDLQTRRLPDALTVDAVASLPIVRGIRLVGRAENIFDKQVVSGISGTGLMDLGTPRTLWIGIAITPLGR